jgi:hypothetical protein
LRGKMRYEGRGQIEREQVDIERESLTEDNESIEQIERRDWLATTRMRGLSLTTSKTCRCGLGIVAS